ncbi:ACP S-malonyltransferase [Eubacterium xylanophilum]|uniref:ACP S-malonyltransferase n=1 Tax=Eubacterium xylanophilum TaxID=39497 RepID=UPI00047CB4CB|nr:ACP S-malonyltransferase [Eubacterium xylanophilum]
MKTVFLYAGQGSQKVGMGQDIYDEFEEYRNVIDNAEVSFDLGDLMKNGPMEKMTQTEYTQPCLAGFAAGVTAVLKANGIEPDAACGLSIGEYGALHAAGVMDAKTYINITEYRGKAMRDAAEGINTSMSAIMGMEPEVIEEACAQWKGDGIVKIANYNCPGQYVICGDEEAVAATEAILKEQGCKRAIRLKVSGPFHTSYMTPAADKLKELFATLEFNEPTIPVALNLTGEFYDKDSQDVKEVLCQQVQNSVRMEKDLETLIKWGADEFIEIGPGKALTGFLKKTAKKLGVDVKAYNIETAEDIKNLLASR